MMFLSVHQTLDAALFRKHVLKTSVLGLLLAFGSAFLLFGTITPPFVPFMPNPDPVHQLLFLLIPLLVSAPLIIKRQNDRGRSPMLFSLYAGLLVGFALFGAAGSTATHAPTTYDLEIFIDRHITHAPITLFGLWLLYDCLFGPSKLPMEIKSDPPAGKQD